MFFLCVKKNGNFLHFSVLRYFHKVVSISSMQATVVQFSTFCNSRLRIFFWQFVDKFDHLSSAFRCSYGIESTVYYSFLLQPNSSPYTHDYPKALLFEIQERRLLAHGLRKNSDFVAGQM